jgi:rhodanese-related sulfurtransferase
MWNPGKRSLCIDMRRCAEVLMFGPLERVDAYIPYVAIDKDEWIDCIEAYKNRSNNIFLQRVDDLVIEHGLNRNNTISLIASSYEQGVMAANLLTVAGYGNVVVEAGGRSGSSGYCAVSEDANLSTTSCCSSNQWIESTSRELIGLLH